MKPFRLRPFMGQKLIARLVLLATLGMAVLTPATPSHAGNSKLWCQGILQSEPQDIRDLRQFLDQEWEQNYGKYALFVRHESGYARIVERILHRVFNVRFPGLAPAARARYIAYILLKWLPIPVSFDLGISTVSNWIQSEIETNKDYSARDLEVLLLTYRAFVLRRPTMARRLVPYGPHDLYKGLQIFQTTSLDMIVSGLATHGIPATLGIAHLPFIPIPFVMTTLVTYKLIKGLPLSSDSVKLVERTEAKFLEVMAPKLSIDGLAKTWNEVFDRIVLKSTDSLTQPGVLATLVEEHTQLLAAQPLEKGKFIRLLLSWAEDTASVNPLDWREVLTSFQTLKITFQKLGFSSEDAKPLFEILANAGKTWTLDTLAKDALQRFLNTPYERQSLPPQVEE